MTDLFTTADLARTQTDADETRSRSEILRAEDPRKRAVLDRIAALESSPFALSESGKAELADLNKMLLDEITYAEVADAKGLVEQVKAEAEQVEALAHEAIAALERYVELREQHTAAADSYRRKLELAHDRRLPGVPPRQLIAPSRQLQDRLRAVSWTAWH